MLTSAGEASSDPVLTTAQIYLSCLADPMMTQAAAA
jgi:hypothetical protein